MRDPGFPADEYLTTRLVMDRDAPAEDGAAAEADRAAFEARYADRVSDLERRLDSERRC